MLVDSDVEFSPEEEMSAGDDARVRHSPVMAGSVLGTSSAAAADDDSDEEERVLSVADVCQRTIFCFRFRNRRNVVDSPSSPPIVEKASK